MSLLGCASEAIAPVGEVASVSDELRVFVGVADRVEESEATGSGEEVLVGLVLRGRKGRLFGCGSELDDPYTVWLSPEAQNLGRPESTINSPPGTNWRVDGALLGNEVRGTVESKARGDRSFTLYAVPVDDPGRAGVYTDHAGCETGLVVVSPEQRQGSCCSDERVAVDQFDARAQVTPLDVLHEGADYMVRCEGVEIPLVRETLEN